MAKKFFIAAAIVCMVSVVGCGSSSSTSTVASQDVWTKTAGQTTGVDWTTKMTTAQKLDLIDGIMSSWQENNVQVNGNDQYFLSGLNAFYEGSSTTQKMNVAQAISLINVGGGETN